MDLRVILAAIPLSFMWNFIILVLEYKEKLVFGDEIKVYKLKETDFVLNFKLTYSHLISKNLNFDEQYFKLFNSISFSHVSYRQHLKKFCLNNNVSPKEINSVNVLLSEHQYLKEFPISGLIVDENKISILSQTSKINSRCFNCDLLVVCGGYMDESVVKCPSYINKYELNISKDSQKFRQNEIKKEGGNKLILNKEIVNYFERMINANSSILEFLIIKYLSKEYLKGFNLAKKKDIERAQFIFSYADMSFVKLLPSDNFAYHYMQTFAMSTKSYLAFKRKNSEEALEMSLNSINHALALKSFEYAEIMGLFISQAFMNIAKVHLYSGNIKKWRSITIDNIDFLLNHKMPANVVNYEGILNKISDKLKYFMLMGVVDDLIINILKNDFKEGYNIIEQVQVRDISIPINKQIQDRVILNIGISKGQVGNEFKKDYHTFMKSSNDIANLTSMKLFLRNRIKKKFKHIYQELNVK